MAQKTDGQLTTEANIIRDETAIGANTALRIGTMFDGLIDSKINNDRVSNNTALGNDATLVPSQNAVKTYVDANTVGLLTDNGNYDPTITSQYPTSGNTLSGGAVQKGDIWFISADGTMNSNAVLIGYSVRALINNAGVSTDADWSISNVGIGYVPENIANKSTDVNLGTSDVYYPSQNSVKAYVDAQVAAVLPYTPENVANKSQDIAANPSSAVLYPSNAAVVAYVNNAGGGSVNTIKVSLTSADILALFTTPFTLIPAQGAGTLINVLKVWYKYNFNTTAYTGGGSLTVIYNNSLIPATTAFSNLLGQTSNYIGRPAMSFSVLTLLNSDIVNVPVTLLGSVAQTLGDSTLDVYITYDVITL
jgi:hypothetical protein